ncbi:hypothetical protein RJT34_10369 [Clitoria ternatea]|uniref:Uncharacterized protein n=1 Tax=Clitoria ternatea TaxID=43366 RepID=A0AAN9K9W0_CLITE
MFFGGILSKNRFCSFGVSYLNFEHMNPWSIQIETERLINSKFLVIEVENKISVAAADELCHGTVPFYFLFGNLLPVPLQIPCVKFPGISGLDAEIVDCGSP